MSVALPGSPIMKCVGVHDSLQTLWSVGALAHRSDAELLELFVREKAESAFEALVDRHGSMVFRACLAVISDTHEAQDCWQATFLLLAKQAHKICNGDSVGSWLFGVARRVAMRSRREATRRNVLKAKWTEIARKRPVPDELWTDLHAEISRLPELERVAIVSCDLEELNHEVAAQRLGWTVRALRKRLYRGRERLRSRLQRRGLTLAPTVVGSLAFTTPSAKAMTEMAVKAELSPNVLSLVKGVSRTMMIPSWKTIAAFALAGTLTLAGGLWTFGRQESPKVEAKTKSAKPAPKIARPSGPTDAEARDLLRKAAEEAMKLDREPLGSWSLTELASAQAESGDREGAKVTFRKAYEDAIAQEKSIKGWNLWRIGHFQLEAGDKAGAIETLSEAIHATVMNGPPLVVPDLGGAVVKGQDQPERIQELVEKNRTVETLGEILKAQARAGDEKGARTTLELMREVFTKIDLRRSPFAKGEFIAALASSGEVDEAFLEIERLLDGQPRSIYIAASALGKMAEAMSDRDLQTARPVVERIAEKMNGLQLDADGQVHPLSQLSHALAYIGRVEEARKMALTIGLGTKGAVDVTDTQPYALFCIALKQDDANDRAGAIETLRMALKTINDRPNMRGRDGRYLQVGCGLASMGDIQSARLALSEMKSNFRPELLAAIANAEKVAGNEKAAQADFAMAIALTRDEIKDLLRSTAQEPIVEEATRADLNSGEAAKLAMGLGALAQIQAQSGNYSAARKTLEAVSHIQQTVNEQNFVAEAYRNAALGWAQSGDLAGALGMALQANTPAAKRMALEGMASGYKVWKKSVKR